MKAFFI